MKRLRRWYLRETVYYRVLPEWPKKYKNEVLAYNKYPSVVTDVVNIVTALERHFEYNRADAIKLAIEIHKQYNKEIREYMKNWFDLGKHEQRIRKLTRKGALKEQRARGFIDKDSFHLDAELPYIQSNIKALVWPKQWPGKKLASIYHKFSLIGVSGWTGIRVPKKLLNR